MKLKKFRFFLAVFAFFVFSLFIFNLKPASADITTGLVSHWKLDETTGTTALDSVGTNNGTVTGATFTTAKINNGLSFDGMDDYVSLSSILPSFSEFSASAWVKVSDLTATRGIFTTGGNNGSGFRFRINPNGSGFLLMAGGGVYDTLTTATNVIQSGTFYHIAVEGKSGQYMRIYINGELAAGKITTQTIAIPASAGYIGKAWNSNLEMMNGLIDEVRIYNRTLTASEVTELYNYTGSVQSAPTATTNSATNIAQTSAALNGTINNNGLTAIAYFEYGLTSAFGNTTPTQTVSDLGAISINSSASNLSPSTFYYYRIVAQSNGGTTYGAVQTFTTTNPPISSSSSSVSILPDWSSWKSWYGVTWRDTPPNNLKYAKQMGYDYIGAAENYNGAGLGYTYYKNNPDVKGMKFYFIDPHTYRSVSDGYKRFIDPNGTFTAAEIAFYNQNMTWKSNDVFPNNMAKGYPSGSTFSLVWDWQQQAVIDKVVESIITMAHRYEAVSTDAGYPFTFAGTIDDTGSLLGEFGAPGQTIAYWTGTDSSLLHSGITHEYATYSDGRAAYFKKLRQRMKQEFPNAKFILEPSRIYHSSWPEEFVRHVKDRADKAELTPDMLSQEGAQETGVEFIDDINIYASFGLNITKDMVGSSQSNQVSESKNRLIAAKAGINSAWFNWFGRWGGAVDLPNFQSITEVYPRLKLIRLIPNWDNLNNIPLANRSWDGSVYQSKTADNKLQSYISSDVMYSRHWKNGKLFVVFNTTNGKIKLNPGETIASIQSTDGYFMEAGDATVYFTVTASSTGAEITLNSSVAIPVDSTNSQIKGAGYILTVSASTSDITKPTGSVSVNNNTSSTDSVNVTLNLAATDNIGVTGYYVSENSTTPTASQPGWTAVTSATTYSANPMFALSSGDGIKTIYAWYKDAGGNISTAYSDSITLAKNDSWKNYYALWSDTATNGVKYAKQMGYDYINGKGWSESSYKNNPDAAGMKFYFVGPHLYDQIYDTIPGYSALTAVANIKTTYAYTQAQIDWYNKYMVWKSNEPFPNNLASGWFGSDSTVFSSMWDFQQQAIIDYVVGKIMTYVSTYENLSGLTFAGFQFDVPLLTGDFFYWNSGMKRATLTYWTGADSGLLHGTITHEYSTYSDGLAAFYKQLMERTRQKYPDAKWILEPARIYDASYSYDEWVARVKSRSDKAELTPDMIMEEAADTQFVDNANNFNSGMNIIKDMVGSHQRGAVEESQNRLIAAKAAINGAWYNWFGNHGGQGNMPNFSKNITLVYPRLKLIRLIPNWDNLNNIPLANRSWDGSVYQSTKNSQPQSYISSDLMYSRHWKTGKVFAVFNTLNGTLKLKQGETISSIKCVDGYFIETTDCLNNFIITDTASGKQLKLKSTVSIPVDSTNNQVMGIGYVIATATGSTGDTTKPTGSLTVNNNASTADSVNVTLNLSVTDNVGVTGYYVSPSSTVPTASQTGWTAVTSTTAYSSNPMFTLSSGDGTKTVYAWYKDAAGNVSSTYSDSITLAKNDSWKNWYGVVARDIAANNLKYAKQIGHDYIGAYEWGPSGTYGYLYYKNNPDVKGMKFYLADPYNYRPVYDGYKRFINSTSNYTQAEKDFYNKYMAWKSNDSFPNNLATGYPSGSTFSTVWDFQQQAVIDKVAENIIALVRSYEASPSDAGYPFTFAGAIFDTAALTGDFAVSGQGQVILSYWTGSDSSALHSGITHEYSTYSDGKAAFFKKLRQRMKEEFPNSKFILAPSRIYHATWLEELIRHIKDRFDKDELTPDMVSQEDSGTTAFVDDTNIYNSGVNITKDMVGISQVSQSAEYENRLYNAKAAVNGAWSNWFMNLGETSGTPNFQSITEVYPRLKLIRLIPNWDNLNNIPLANRSWDGSVYQSTKNSQPQSYISSDLMYSRHWKTGKVFAVFNTLNGTLKLKQGETISSIKCVDGYFIETTDCLNNFIITDTASGKQLKLKSTVSIPVDSTNNQVMGIGYVIATAGGSSSSSVQSSSSSQPSSSSSSSSVSQSSSSSSSSKFKANDRVKTTSNLNVRSTASLTGTLLGTQAVGSLGTVVSGPVSSGGYNWYYVNYDIAPDGWSVDNYLEKTVSSSSSSSSSTSQSSSQSSSSSSVGGGNSSSSSLQSSQSSTGNTGGGGGGGGGGITVSVSSAQSSSSVSRSSSVSISSSLNPSSFTQTSSYRFTRELRYGFRGSDITELQNRLTSEGVYSGPITGYYGLMTREAVRKYQAKNNLPPVGAVGPMTLSSLNKSSSGSPTTPSSSANSTSSSQGFTLRQLVELLISLGVISPDKADLARTALKSMEGR